MESGCKSSNKNWQELFKNAASLVRLSHQYSDLLTKYEKREISLIEYQQKLCRLEFEVMSKYDSISNLESADSYYQELIQIIDNKTIYDGRTNL